MASRSTQSTAVGSRLHYEKQMSQMKYKQWLVRGSRLKQTNISDSSARLTSTAVSISQFNVKHSNREWSSPRLHQTCRFRNTHTNVICNSVFVDIVHRLYFNKITTFRKLDLLPSSGTKARTEILAAGPPGWAILRPGQLQHRWAQSNKRLHTSALSLSGISDLCLLLKSQDTPYSIYCANSTLQSNNKPSRTSLW
jgi:hypothetical protein